MDFALASNSRDLTKEKNLFSRSEIGKAMPDKRTKHSRSSNNRKSTSSIRLPRTAPSQQNGRPPISRSYSASVPTPSLSDSSRASQIQAEDSPASTIQ